ncbi:Protein kinase C-binding NELL1-like protein [Operophtera brumata]|uniref:Protein kinase C-binding NELL1-like protein n=1 Tax=Operophtera brumata TaxID=104452 RepID=A0A0L7LB97_OPEBR|nr:Protein kinase C-binding NELL1-like protein [Operophtera brumata]
MYGGVPGDSRSLQVEGDAFERAAELLRLSPEFTVLATLRQEPANSGTILSFSHGYNRTEYESVRRASGDVGLSERGHRATFERRGSMLHGEF